MSKENGEAMADKKQAIDKIAEFLWGFLRANHAHWLSEPEKFEELNESLKGWIIERATKLYESLGLLKDVQPAQEKDWIVSDEQIINELGAIIVKHVKTKPSAFIAAEILDHLREIGVLNGIRLDPDQSLPKNPYYPGQIGYSIYSEAVCDMIKAGFKKVLAQVPEVKE